MDYNKLISDYIEITNGDKELLPVIKMIGLIKIKKAENAVKFMNYRKNAYTSINRYRDSFLIEAVSVYKVHRFFMDYTEFINSPIKIEHLIDFSSEIIQDKIGKYPDFENKLIFEQNDLIIYERIFQIIQAGEPTSTDKWILAFRESIENANFNGTTYQDLINKGIKLKFK